MLELGYSTVEGDTEAAKANFKIGYTIYISGDILKKMKRGGRGARRSEEGRRGEWRG